MASCPTAKRHFKSPQVKDKEEQLATVTLLIKQLHLFFFSQMTSNMNFFGFLAAGQICSCSQIFTQLSEITGIVHSLLTGFLFKERMIEV